MHLTVREAASYLGITEASLRRWIIHRDLPIHRANERIYLNAVELWEWATEHNVPVSRTLLDRARGSPDDFPPLSELLRRGGIHHDLPGENKANVLREVLKQLPLPAEIDREFLLSVLEAREAMGSTGIGDGIAIPHVRNPILLQIDAPFVTLCLLRHAVDFDAIDGRPVHALFVVVSPTVPGHLRALSQLGFVLRDEELRRLLGKRATGQSIMDRIELLESQSRPRTSDPGRASSTARR
jgi:PTS system nitrogen regulatory IIA component